MATALPVIRRALRLINVIDAEEAPTADQAQSGVEALNGMISRWQRDNISLPFVPIADSADELRVPAEALEAVAFNLALTLAPEFGATPSILVAEGARQGYRAMLRDSSGVAHADLSSMPNCGYDASDLF